MSDPFKKVQSGDPLRIPAASHNLFVDADAPTSSHWGRCGILLGPVRDLSVGLACVAGVCTAKVDVIDTGHGFADVSHGLTPPTTRTLKRPLFLLSTRLSSALRLSPEGSSSQAASSVLSTGNPLARLYNGLTYKRECRS